MRVVWLLALVGCYRPSEVTCTPCTTEADCPVGLACVDQVCGNECPREDADIRVELCAGDADGFVQQTCFLVNPIPREVAEPLAIDTDDPTQCDVPLDRGIAHPDVCFLASNGLTISATLRGVGARPLVLWSASTVAITSTGVVDVASHRGESVRGAGADDAVCPNSVRGASTVLDGKPTGSGGCGGTFVTPGGKGGAGHQASVGGGVGVTCVFGLLVVDRLRGGCPGGAGGLASNGGASGGAVYVMAGATIDVAGVINASGAGAAIASKLMGFEGGGGGGSGGLIVLDAPVVNLANALLLALGGGGGSGTGIVETANVDGLPGDEVDITDPIDPFPARATHTVDTNNGGSARSVGGEDGGNVGAQQSGGGGGGGGGAGAIRIFAAQSPIGTARNIQPPLVF